MSIDNIDKLLEERGAQYGDFDTQVRTITKIMNRLRQVGNRQNSPISNRDVYNFFLVLKLVRFQTANDPDSLDDLQGYARLIRKAVFGKPEGGGK